MYKANSRGSTKGKSGKQHRWKAGDTIDVEQDELAHAFGLEWEGLSRDDLKDKLDEASIEYDGRTSTKNLKKLWDSSQ